MLPPVMPAQKPPRQSPLYAIALVVVILAAGAGLYAENMRLNQVAASIPTTSATNTTPTTPTSSPQVIVERPIDAFNGSTNPLFVFRHECLGTVVPTEAVDGSGVTGNVSYCDGTNWLVVSKDGGPWQTLVTIPSTSAKDAPYFDNALFVTPNNNGSTAQIPQEIVLAFYSGSCVLDGDFCGAGMDWQFFNYALNTQTMELKTIKNYPGTGELFWDNAGHAAFVPETCGGGGCGTTTIGLYDLNTDTVNDQIVTDLGVGDSQYLNRLNPPANPTDENGKKQAVWTKLGWNSRDTLWHATLLNADGTTKTVTFAAK